MKNKFTYVTRSGEKLDVVLIFFLWRQESVLQSSGFQTSYAQVNNKPKSQGTHAFTFRKTTSIAPLSNHSVHVFKDIFRLQNLPRIG